MGHGRAAARRAADQDRAPVAQPGWHSPPGEAPPGANAVAGTVADLAFRGDSATCLVTAGRETLRVTLAVDAHPLPARGDAVILSWAPEALVPLAG